MTRWAMVGDLLRKGALLWKCPATDRAGKQKRIDAMDNHAYPALDKDLIYSLVNNSSYEEYERLRESHIPELMVESSVVPPIQIEKEDYAWLNVSEQDIDGVLKEEEGNLREEDLDGIIDAEMKVHKKDDDILESFKSFLSSTSNLEGIDSIVGGSNASGLHIDFDSVCNILQGGRWILLMTCRILFRG